MGSTSTDDSEVHRRTFIRWWTEESRWSYPENKAERAVFYTICEERKRRLPRSMLGRMELRFRAMYSALRRYHPEVAPDVLIFETSLHLCLLRLYIHFFHLFATVLHGMCAECLRSEKLPCQQRAHTALRARRFSSTETIHRGVIVGKTAQYSCCGNFPVSSCTVVYSSVRKFERRGSLKTMLRPLRIYTILFSSSYRSSFLKVMAARFR